MWELDVFKKNKLKRRLNNEELSVTERDEITREIRNIEIKIFKKELNRMDSFDFFIILIAIIIILIGIIIFDDLKKIIFYGSF